MLVGWFVGGFGGEEIVKNQFATSRLREVAKWLSAIGLKCFFWAKKNFNLPTFAQSDYLVSKRSKNKIERMKLESGRTNRIFWLVEATGIEPAS